MDDFLKGMAQIGKAIHAAGERAGKWLEENGIKSKDLEGIVEELSNNLYENTKVVIEHNSQYGWTLAASMSTLVYIEDELVGKSGEELDTYFYDYYSATDWEEYQDLKNDLKKRIDSKWSELLGDCFFLFENKRYKAAIPILFSIVDGELAKALETHSYGGKLVQVTKRAATDEEARFRKSVLYSVLRCLEGEMFSHSSFEEERKGIINRNWVMHGRDNPMLWKEVDVLKLLTILDSAQFIQMIAEEQ